MSLPSEHAPHDRAHASDEHSVPELEADQTVPPRPEEDLADALRAEPDLEDHSGDPA